MSNAHADTIEISRRRYDALMADQRRLDWLSDRDNPIGNVMLPTAIVARHLDNLRDAIDEAMALAAREDGE